MIVDSKRKNLLRLNRFFCYIFNHCTYQGALMILLLHSGYISFLLFKYFACRWKNAIEWQQKVKVTANMGKNRIFIYVIVFLSFGSVSREEKYNSLWLLLTGGREYSDLVLYKVKFFVIHLLNIACSVLL